MASNSTSSHSSRTRYNPRSQTTHSFVFGSSTPRELSHINAVTRQERLIDAKLKKNPVHDGAKRDIIYYMRQARSIECTGPNRKGLPDNYAFGSSTPRSLSHLSNMAKGQRVYDSKVEKRTNECAPRSETNPQLARQRGDRSLSRDSRPDEEASSEPDIIQDRKAEFITNMNRTINKDKIDESPTESRKSSKSRQIAPTGGSKKANSKGIGQIEEHDKQTNDLLEGKLGELPFKEDINRNHAAISSNERLEEGTDEQQSGMASREDLDLNGQREERFESEEHDKFVQEREESSE